MPTPSVKLNQYTFITPSGTYITTAETEEEAYNSILKTRLKEEKKWNQRLPQKIWAYIKLGIRKDLEQATVYHDIVERQPKHAKNPPPNDTDL